MRSFFKRAMAMTLCAAMVLGASGCDKQSDKTSQSVTSAKYGTVWSAPSTVKIDQSDIAYENKGEAELVFNAVKNEYESHQLLITASKDIKEYYLESNDLTCGENTLSKDNITVYMEKYTKMAEAAYGSYSLPDALIPVDTAKKYEELTIAKDQNGAFWVTVYIPEDTPAGVYEGTFKLTVDGSEMDIPVKVTVNDYVLPKTTTGQTLFSWRYDRVGAGELDSGIEMMECYYEYFLDYRISLQSLPLESTTREEIVDALEKYYDTLTTYTICPEPGKVPGGETITYADKTKEMIYAIASISSPEKNYFEKAMLYVVDEPDLRDDAKYQYTMKTLESMNLILADCVEVIKNDKSGEFDAFKSIKEWEKSILDIPNIMPIVTEVGTYIIDAQDNARSEEFLSAINTICPVFGVWEEQLAEKLLVLCEKYDIENLWWYGCNGPFAPYGNYHLGDKNLLSARSCSWVQAKYGIEGNLYWDAAAYTSERPNWDQYMNVYESPIRIEGSTAGDGTLTYPGAPYGIYGPLPSVRLMAIRDGMEELEMLYALENQYEKLEKTYGKEFNAHDSIVSLIDKLCYNGALYYADGEKGLDFDAVRGSLIDSVVWNNMGIGFALEGSDIKNNIATVSYYISDECKVYVGEELQTPVSGCKYEYPLDLTKNTSLDFIIETADGNKYEVSRFIAFPTKTLQAFEDETVVTKFTTSEGGAVNLNKKAEYATEGASLQLKVKGKVTGNELLDAAYVPTISMDTSIFESIGNLTEVPVINMDIYNPGKEFKMQLKIYSGSSFVSLGEYMIDHGKNTINLPIGETSFASMAEADRMVFEFANSTDGKKANKYEFYLDNFVAEE